MTRSSERTDARRDGRLRRRPLGPYRYVRLRWRVTFAVVDLLGTALFAVARFVRRLAAGEKTIRTGQEAAPKVLLLVQLDHLGDAILSTAMLPLLRARYPEASIEVLCGPWNREVFEASAEIDRVHVSRVNRFARGSLARFAWIPAMFWWGLKLRRQEVDLGIDVRGEFPVAVILWLCGARRRLGWASPGGRFLLTDVAPFVADRSEIESRMALLAVLGIGLSTAEPPRPRFQPADGVGRLIDRRLAASRVTNPPGRPRVVLHVGAGTPGKTWPWQHWRELLGRIIVDHGAEVILVGSGRDRATAERILGGEHWPGVVDWTGRLSIEELGALLQRADVLVGADSGPAHLAAAVDTAVVVLFSGTNYSCQWQPCGRHVKVIRHEVQCQPCHRRRCPRADHPCMRLLQPRQVAAEVARALSEGVGTSGRNPRRKKGVRQ